MNRIIWWLCATLLAATAGLACAEAPSPPPVEAFTRTAAIREVKISPSGRRLAMILNGPQGRWRLGVMDLDPVTEPRIVADYLTCGM